MLMNENDQSKKEYVSISEMARMCGLSRGRFYQLMGTTFPFPVYLIDTRRPVFTEELQRVCMEVRRRNLGIDGKPILFYARRIDGINTGSKKVAVKKRKPVTKSSENKHAELIETLGQLGLEVNASAVSTAMTTCFPNGTQDVDAGEVIATIFRHFKASNRRNTGDNVGR